MIADKYPKNRQIRDFYPKKTDFREVSDANITKVEINLMSLIYLIKSCIHL
jgi:IS30 family transposase